MKERTFTRKLQKRQLELAGLKVGQMFNAGEFTNSKRKVYYKSAESLGIRIAVRNIDNEILIWRVK